MQHKRLAWSTQDQHVRSSDRVVVFVHLVGWSAGRCQHIAEDRGWNILTCNTVREAIRSAIRLQPDVMLIEVGTPLHSTLRLLSAAHRTRCSHVVIALTQDAAIEQQLRSAGADVVLLLPQNQSQLDPNPNLDLVLRQQLDKLIDLAAH